MMGMGDDGMVAMGTKHCRVFGALKETEIRFFIPTIGLLWFFNK